MFGHMTLDLGFVSGVRSVEVASSLSLPHPASYEVWEGRRLLQAS